MIKHKLLMKSGERSCFAVGDGLFIKTSLCLLSDRFFASCWNGIFHCFVSTSSPAAAFLIEASAYPLGAAQPTTPEPSSPCHLKVNWKKENDSRDGPRTPIHSTSHLSPSERSKNVGRLNFLWRERVWWRSCCRKLVELWINHSGRHPALSFLPTRVD